MKQLIFISVLILFVFSCKKEKLKYEKEVFIGEWELQFVINKNQSMNPGNSYCFLDTVFATNANKTMLTFKEKGKIILKIDNKKKGFSVNFKEKKGENISFKSSADTLKICSKTFTEIGELHGFNAIVQSTFQFSKYITLNGKVNEDWLILYSSPDIIDEPYNEFIYNGYTNFFKRVN